MSAKLKLSRCIINILGSAILAFGIYNIHSISGVTEGGVLGFTLLLEHWFEISPAISGFVLNAICYIIGWRKLGKNFIFYSVFAGGGFSLFYAIFERFPRVYPQIADYPLIAALIGAVFVGVGVGIAVRAGGAPSGDDALAMGLSQTFATDIKWIYLISDVSVLALSLSYIPPLEIFWSFITVFLSGQIISIIQNIGNTEAAATDERFNPRDVLVGTLRNHEQLEICLKNKFYHIPAVRVYSNESPIRYVAIYFSNSKFGLDAGVRYWGEVEKRTLVHRNQIREIPKNSTELYYRFDIKEWKQLPKPLTTREHDFINLMTTRYLLENSGEVSELCLRSFEEKRLYSAILESICSKNSAREIPYDKFTIVFKYGRIILCKKRKELFSCCVDEYLNHPSAYFRRIMDIIENLHN